MRISVVLVVAVAAAVVIVSYHCRRGSVYSFFYLYCVEFLSSIFLHVIISHELLTNLLELQTNEKAVNVLHGLCSVNGSDELKNFKIY